MTQIVNLNKARKLRAKQAGIKAASQNRIIFGLTRPEREAARREAEKQARKVDASRLPPDHDQEN